MAGRPYAQPAPASEDEIAAFVGRWAMGPADRPGFETLAAGNATCDATVEIRLLAPGRIVRIVTRRDGGISRTEFWVKRLGRTFPWWPVEPGPGIVARRLDDGGFVLARLVEGRADWDNASRHRRCG